MLFNSINRIFKKRKINKLTKIYHKPVPLSVKIKATRKLLEINFNPNEKELEEKMLNEIRKDGAPSELLEEAQDRYRLLYPI